MFNLFKKKKEPIVITATLNARLQPLDRAEIEDALDETMSKYGHKVSVVGGGTALKDNGEISYCDIEIQIDEPSDELINLVIGTVEAMFAPKGSYASIPDQDKPIPFGKLEGLGLYLNGTDLHNETYKNCSADEVREQCDILLEGIGYFESSWNGSNETALYFYGSSFAIMQEKITPFLKSYALCEKCRIEQIA
jgi:hypothetical protein